MNTYFITLKIIGNNNFIDLHCYDLNIESVFFIDICINLLTRKKKRFGRA